MQKNHELIRFPCVKETNAQLTCEIQSKEARDAVGDQVSELTEEVDDRAVPSSQ